MFWLVSRDRSWLSTVSTEEVEYKPKQVNQYHTQPSHNRIETTTTLLAGLTDQRKKEEIDEVFLHISPD